MCKKSKVSILIIVFLLIALAVVGSFYDFEIAKAVYLGELPKENFFGVAFAFVGIIPVFVGWSFLGAIIFTLTKKQIECQAKRRWLIAFSILLFVLAFFFFCNTLMMVNANAFSVHWAIAYPLGIAILFLAGFAGYKLANSNTNESLLKTTLILAFASLLIMILVSSTKVIMNRPRFRLVVKTANADCFVNWWQSGKAIKQSLKTSAVSNDFSSFPSGHSAYSLFAIFIFPALADFYKKLQNKKTLLFVAGFVWWLLTALSRMTIGAHYLTDVCFSGLITVVSYLMVSAISIKLTKKQN